MVCAGCDSFFHKETHLRQLSSCQEPNQGHAAVRLRRCPSHVLSKPYESMLFDAISVSARVTRVKQRRAVAKSQAWRLFDGGAGQWMSRSPWFFWKKSRIGHFFCADRTPFRDLLYRSPVRPPTHDRGTGYEWPVGHELRIEPRRCRDGPIGPRCVVVERVKPGHCQVPLSDATPTRANRPLVPVLR